MRKMGTVKIACTDQNACKLHFALWIESMRSYKGESYLQITTRTAGGDLRLIHLEIVMQFKKNTMASVLLPVLGAVLVQACTDVSRDFSPITLPDNFAPIVTSAQLASVPEGTTDTVYTATATDSDGDQQLTYSINGPDAAEFIIDSNTGVVRFASEPDFEAPTDGNFDNVYTFNLTVTDPEGASSSRLISITVTDIVDTGQRYLEKIFTDLDVQNDVEYAPGLTLDVYAPLNDTATDRPVIIIAFGGGFVAGDRSSVQEIAEDFAQRGYVAASISYRLASGQLDADGLVVAGVDATHDMFAAVRFFRADAIAADEFGTRPDAIFVSGESAGGVMAAIAATLDPNDTINSPTLSAYLASNGGVYGDVGDHVDVPSDINGAFPIAGGVLDLSWVDVDSTALYASHFVLDNTVPCRTAVETVHHSGLVISGACDLVPAYEAAGASAESFLVPAIVGHVEFTDEQRTEMYDGAASFFFYNVLWP